MTQYLPQKPAAIPLIAALAANSYFIYGNFGVMTMGIVPYVLDQSSSETVKAMNWFIENGKVRSPCICVDLKDFCNPLTISRSTIEHLLRHCHCLRRSLRLHRILYLRVQSPATQHRCCCFHVQYITLDGRVHATDKQVA